MLVQDYLALTRAEPNGEGGLQFVYRLGQYGVACVSAPKEEVSMIHWSADVIKFKNDATLQYDICHTTELADRTLNFRNDKAMNEFLEKAFTYLKDIQGGEG
jgi:hypothetical protein